MIMEGVGSQTTNLIVYCEQPNLVQQYQSLLDLSGLSTQIATSESELWGTLEKHPADLILLSTSYPDPPAFPLCMSLKAPGSRFRELPIVVVFPAETPPEIALQALHLGAYDYLIEPFNEIALLTKLTVLARIKRAEDEFRGLAITDVVTGLYDQRYLFLRAEEELSRAKRYSRPFSVVTISIDNLASAETEFGHGASNDILQATAEILRNLKRQIDVLATESAGIFTLVLYNTDEPGALVVANRILLQMKGSDCGLAGFLPSVSIGLTSLNASPQLTLHSQELLQQAAAAMQQAKQQGGGSIVIYTGV